MSLTFDHPFRNRALYNFDDNIQQPRHRWYPFKEGFSNQLVREAIQQQISPQRRKIRVLDAFGGSGTTVLTAALMGHNAVSVEINPFFTFASRVKCVTGDWDAKQLRARIAEIISEATLCDKPSSLEGVSTFSEGDENTKWLFNTTVLRAYAATMSLIPETGGEEFGALRLAAIRAAMMCCNAKKDGKCLRYYRDWKERAYDGKKFFQYFCAVAEIMIEDVAIAPIGKSSKTEILRNDSRQALADLQADSFDLFVTSPPYLNSFDYSDVYRPELFLSGFVADNEDLRKIRLKTLRSHVQVNWTGETQIDNQQVKSLVTRMKETKELWNKRLPEMVEAYFHDMQKVLLQVARLLRRGGKAWIVVSTSAYKALQIPVDLILAEIGTQCGLTLESVNVLRNLRAAGQQWPQFAGGVTPPLRESLIIFRRR
jgi:hypothetical protein